jgi:hypothetical protein
MKIARYVFLAVLFAAGAFCFAQSGGTQSIEESYLSESVEMTVIREYSQQNDYAGKMAALDFIEDFIAAGNVGKEVVAILHDLSLEGIHNKVYEGGRVTNNFPDVRARAIRYLGECTAPDAVEPAQKSIVQVMAIDKEPNVQYEAINALAKLKGDTVRASTAATQSFISFDARNPDNRVTVSLLNFYESLIDAGQPLDSLAVRTILQISSSSLYTYPVREQAKALLTKARKSAK